MREERICQTFQAFIRSNEEAIAVGNHKGNTLTHRGRVCHLRATQNLPVGYPTLG